VIANVSAHRRANAFAQALEEQSERGTAAEPSAGEAPPPKAGEQTEQSRLLALAAGLGALPRPQLDPEVKTVQRARLVAAMEAMAQAGEADATVPEQRSAQQGRGTHRAASLRGLRPRSRLTKGLAAGGLSVGVAAGAFGGVAAASDNALPGDSLYGLKRGIEDFKLNYLAHGDDERGRAYLDQASTRLNEARRLLDRGRGGHLDHETLGEIRRTLNGVQHDASEGHRLLHEAYARDPDSLGPIQALSAFSRSHRETWGALRDQLPVQLGDVSDQVTSVFDAIDQEVAPLQSLLPQLPDQGGSSRRPGPGTGSASESAAGGPAGSGHPTAPSSGGDSATGSERSGGSPSRSAGPGDDEGLLGGGTGGLIDPPKTSGSASPSQSGTPSGSNPDVTIPPLLPGLLPDLGIDGESNG
jgi:hypothetical protein